MTTAGWILMLGSVGFVLTLTGYCFDRVLTAPPRHHSTSRSDRETGA
jgi:hypothetical protein